MSDGEDRVAEIKVQLEALEALLGIEIGVEGDPLPTAPGDTRLDTLAKASADLADVSGWVTRRAEALKGEE